MPERGRFVISWSKPRHYTDGAVWLLGRGPFGITAHIRIVGRPHFPWTVEYGEKVLAKGEGATLAGAQEAVIDGIVAAILVELGRLRPGVKLISLPSPAKRDTPGC